MSLDCKICPEDAQAQAWTAYYYDLLQCTLQQEGLPETVDLTKEPRTGELEDSGGSRTAPLQHLAGGIRVCVVILFYLVIINIP